MTTPPTSPASTNPPLISKRQQKRDRKRLEWTKKLESRRQDERKQDPLAPRKVTNPTPISQPRQAEIYRNRTLLPIWEHRDVIRTALRDRDVLVMLGETGSGKSTQIGQFLRSEAWASPPRGGCIAITQPRRVAAVNLARRVAEEMGVALGREVGYSVRFDNRSCEATKIKFLTDGMLLQEMIRDPLLKRYSAIVVDEAHERTVATDLCIGFLRNLVYGKRKGGGLKVVVMSATMEVEKIAVFFERDREGAAAFLEARWEEKLDAQTVANGVELNGSGHRRGGIEGNGAKNGEEPPGGIGDLKGRSEKRRNGHKIRKASAGSAPTHPLAGEENSFKSTSPQVDGAGRPRELYNGTVATFTVPGRQFQVEVHHSAEPVEDYVAAALRTVFQLHYGEPMPGDMLVFLTGQDEIESLQKLIEDYAESMDKSVPKILVLPLYAALPPALQQRVFHPPPERNTRKIILSTNIAETSVTVPGVRHVIDCGKSKTKQYRPRIGLESLLVTPISKSSAMQRAGRAGREAPGKCFRLYTEAHFSALADTTVPEMLRCDVAAAILTLKARGQDDVLAFDYLDPPDRGSLVKGLEHLYALGALDSTGKISELGRKMARLPLPPALARVLVAAAEPEMECLGEVIDIIAALSVENLLVTPTGDEKREEMEEARKELGRREGDHVMLLALVRAYEAQDGQKKAWTEKHFVSWRAMQNLMNVRKQLKQYSQRLTPTLAVPADADTIITPALTTRILKCLLKGFFHNTARLCPDGSYRTTIGSQPVAIHPSSILYGKKVEAIMYHEFVYTTRPFARAVSAVQMDWLVEAAPGVQG